jgi:2-(1,2-epoxy-1,2-dihydrophenyl)acetyl-CoA isomerase
LREYDGAAGIATLTFNRPDAYNALNVEMAMAFREAVAWLRSLSGLRCIVLTGAGKAFMAGGDIGAFGADLPQASETLADILCHMHPALMDLRAFDAPVLAAVNGPAAGAGFSLVAVADYAVARQSAKFVLAYNRLGVAPDCGGTWFLPRKIGRTLIFSLMLKERQLTAVEAMDMGLINEVADNDDFAKLVRQTAKDIASGPTLAFGHLKRLLDQDVPLATHLEQERHAFMSAAKTKDFSSAVNAFLGKVDPTFVGA